MPLPEFNTAGDLPPDIYQATLQEVIDRFGTDTVRRQVMALRLERIYQIATETGHLARFIVFGSFITDKPEPNDVDVFMLMEDTFDFDAWHCRDCTGGKMIANDNEFQVTFDRIARFQRQLAHLRQVEKNPANYRASASGFLAEIDRMQLQVREYLSLHPADLVAVPEPA